MDFLKDLSLDKVRNLAEDAFNQAKPKTDLEAKVYEVLSHKNWGASSTLMNEIARDTFDYDKFAVISQIMWEAMENQRPAAWRIVFKGLTLLEHLIKNGSERCVDDARNHGHSLRALHQFNYYEGTIDRGLGVREKSKQLVDILADDDRIREERQRARKLREKFGASMGGTGSSGGGGGGGGYGNDNWSSNEKSAGSGYGDGGIGSNRSGGGGGRYDDDRDGAGGGYSGRYDDATSTAAAAPTPTFAAIPDETPKKSKGKKKKKSSDTTASEEPAVDLFSFDDPTSAPAAAAVADDDEFDNFQSAGGAFVAPVVVDPFAAPMQQPLSAPVQQQTTQFDAFGGASNHSQQQQQFDVFATAPVQPPMASNMFRSSNVMGGGGMMQQPMGGSVMGRSNIMGGRSAMTGGMGVGMNVAQPQRQQQVNDDDDFGDFADAGPSKTVSSAPTSSNPLNKLISLDGLSKNSNKVEDKLNQPIIANAAAATFVQEKDQIQAAVQKSAKGSNMSFAGIDGLHHNSSMMGGQMNTMMPPAMSMGMNPSVMGSGGASASLIGMLDPNAMMQKNHSSQQISPQLQQGMMNPQMHGMNPQMMSGAGMGNMNPNMPQQGFGGMQGGMMQGGGMMSQQQMMMNYPGMGMGTQGNPGMGMAGMQGNPGMGMAGMQGNPGMGMNGMQGQSMNGFNGGMQPGMDQQNGSSMGGGPMGGQPMGGFR